MENKKIISKKLKLNQEAWEELKQKPNLNINDVAQIFSANYNAIYYHLTTGTLRPQYRIKHRTRTTFLFDPAYIESVINNDIFRFKPVEKEKVVEPISEFPHLRKKKIEPVSEFANFKRPSKMRKLYCSKCDRYYNYPILQFPVPAEHHCGVCFSVLLVLALVQKKTDL